MRVVVFIENVQHGGLDTFCATLIDAWPEATDEFIVVVNRSHPGREWLQARIRRPCTFVVHDIPLSWAVSRRLLAWLPASLRRAAQPAWRIVLLPWQIARLKGQLESLRGDALLVINGGFPGGESCRLASIVWPRISDVSRARRHIHNFHNNAVAARPALAWFEDAIDRGLARSAARLISVSASCAESLRVRPAFRGSQQIGYIYNGIDMGEAIHDSAAAPDLRVLLEIGNAPLCLVLANYEARKGHRFLFEAFAQVSRTLPQAHLVTCGGSTAQEWEAVHAARRAVAPDAKIHLLKFVPGGASLIGQADVLAISSQSFESFGLTAVEAMVRQIPVVATRVGGLPEVVGPDGIAGFTVEARDVQGFADRLTRLLADPALRREMGVRGACRAASLFTAERMARQYREALFEAAARPDAAHDDPHSMASRHQCPSPQRPSTRVPSVRFL